MEEPFRPLAESPLGYQVEDLGDHAEDCARGRMHGTLSRRLRLTPPLARYRLRPPPSKWVGREGENKAGGSSIGRR